MGMGGGEETTSTQVDLPGWFKDRWKGFETSTGNVKQDVKNAIKAGIISPEDVAALGIDFRAGSDAGKIGDASLRAVRQGSIEPNAFADLIGGGAQPPYPGVLPSLDRIASEQIQAGGQNALTNEALAGMEGRARQGTAMGDMSVNALQQLLGQGGVAPATSGLAGGLIGGQFTNPAMGQAAHIAGGGDVGRNPFLDAAYDRAAQGVTRNFNEVAMPGMDRAFAQSGRMGSGQYALLRNRAEENVGNTLGDLATSIYGGAYDSERNRQMGALGQVAGLGQQDVSNRIAGAGLLDQGTARQLQGIGLGSQANALRYDDLSRLYGVGQQQMQAPWQPIQQYSNALLAPLFGGGQTQSTPLHNNQAGNALGGAMAGAQIGTAISPGWGTAIGAGLGGIGGYFG